MIGKLLGLLWALVKLPFKILLLPFKIVSMILSLVFYLGVLLLLGAIIFVFVL